MTAMVKRAMSSHNLLCSHDMHIVFIQCGDCIGERLNVDISKEFVLGVLFTDKMDHWVEQAHLTRLLLF